MGEAEQDPQSTEVTLPIEWHVSDTIQSHYATNFIIQSGQNEFIISFFETRLPIFMGQPEENKAQLEQIGSIRAECVSRVIVAAEQLPVIIAAMQASLEAYRTAKSAE